MKEFKALSYFRRLYHGRFIFRCAVLLLTLVLYIVAPSQFFVLEPFGFFHGLSVFHVLWVLWMIDMVLQLCPSRNYWPLGSQKFLKTSFQPLMDKLNREGLLEYVIKSNKDTIRIGLVWLALTLIIGALYFTGVIGRNMLLLISVAFYVCDLICVLFWCPFRVWFMKNRCCTTCRIFNWDHLMMFAPVVFIPSFYTWTLCLVALVVFLVWEITFAIHPERFWEGSNASLSCSSCTDVLCGKRNCRFDIPKLENLKADPGVRENTGKSE
jgi:hypothetical protein